MARLGTRGIAGLAVALAMAGSGAGAAPLQPPVAFESANGQLNLIMTARPAPIGFDGVTTTGWVYEICRRASETATTCQPGTMRRPYGGVRLRLQRNDTLSLRLVNHLPTVPDAKHCQDNPDLAGNPTNLHTHGLIVEPHRSTGGTDAYGDYVFVEIRNPANAGAACAPQPAGSAAAPATDAPATARRSASRRGRAGSPPSPPPPHVATAHQHGQPGAAAPGDAAPGGVHPDMDVADGAVEYRIHLVNHPSGLFWFHPHMHGVALNQVTAGLSGIITVGTPEDDCRGDHECRAAIHASTERFLVLKDSEVLADGALLSQQDPGFCPGAAAAGEPPRRGVCAGDAAGGFGGGHWFHTVNGQVYPDIRVGPGGDLWRIVNAAASRSYDLSLAPDGGGEALPLQVLSIDGITIDASLAANLPALQAQLGRKVDVFPCPDPPGAARRREAAVCTRHIRMMPSSRVAVRVLNDQPGARNAVFRTADYPTGPDADDWPAIDLASVHLAAPAAHGIVAALVLPSGGGVRSALSPDGVLGAPPSLLAPGARRPAPLERVQQQAAAAPTSPAARRQAQAMAAARPGLRQATEYAIDPALKLGLRHDPACDNLAPGERRRIFFGNPTPGQDGFGLATVVIGADGQEKPGTATPMRVFDPTQTTICLTAARGAGSRPTTETWEVFNLTGEDHNFHIHQTRFWLLSTGPTQPARIDEVAVLQDNVPLLHAADVSGCDGTVDHFHTGACKPQAVMLRIPFTQVGDFVFHCHILEHEDGGMMARIRVVAPPPPGHHS